MFTLPGHPGENSTYNQQFRGPQFECTTSRYNSTLPLHYEPGQYLEAPIFISAWDNEELIYSLTRYDSIEYSVRCGSDSNLAWKAYTVVEKQVCKSKSVLFNVRATFSRGVQTVAYSLSDTRTLPSPADLYDMVAITGRSDLYPEQNSRAFFWVIA